MNGDTNYDDIINLDRPISKKHMPMDVHDRAAQFAAFAALTGYDDAIDEAARLTNEFIELSEEEKNKLDYIISSVSNEKINSTKTFSITYFIKDEKKSGGRYEISAGKIKKIDRILKNIHMDNGDVIPIDYIIDMEYEKETN